MVKENNKYLLKIIISIISALLVLLSIIVYGVAGNMLYCMAHFLPFAVYIACTWFNKDKFKPILFVWLAVVDIATVIVSSIELWLEIGYFLFFDFFGIILAIPWLLSAWTVTGKTIVPGIIACVMRAVFLVIAALNSDYWNSSTIYMALLFLFALVTTIFAEKPAQLVENNTKESDCDKIIKLNALQDSGVITAEEFDTKKKEILGL